MLQNLAVQANSQMNPGAPNVQAGNNNAAVALLAQNGESSEYNELLYAHLLDERGERLTYTHFTAKVRFSTFPQIGTF